MSDGPATATTSGGVVSPAATVSGGPPGLPPGYRVGPCPGYENVVLPPGMRFADPCPPPPPPLP